MTSPLSRRLPVRDEAELRRVLGSGGATAPDRRLGDILVAAGIVSPGDLEQALAVQRHGRRRHLGRILVDLGLVDAERVHEALACKFGIPCVRLDGIEIAAEILGRVPAELAMRLQLLPLAEIDGRLVVAMEQPFDTTVARLLEFNGIGPVVPVQAPARQLALAHARCYGATGPGKREAGEDDRRPVVQAVNAILVQAVLRGASDIHVRPERERVSVWYRIDGTMHRARTLDRSLLPALVSRIKVLGGMNIAERRLPQEGRAGLTQDGQRIDLRISILPTVAGESVVIRILDRSAGLKPLDGLGLPGEVLERIRGLLGHPHGMFLVTGPTGSGKSTTLYAVINEVRRRDVHVLTVEDPVEYDMAGIEQVRVAEGIGLGFAEVLKRFLRHDPDVIMVGEIRDAETAAIATRAALTGHFVLSTLHTNDAPGTVNRLIDMGIDPGMLAATLRGVMAQRLVRLICPRCSAPDTTAIGQLAGRYPDLRTQDLRRGAGCASCDDSGYAGRAVVCEVLAVTPAIARLIAGHAPAVEIGRTAREAGMAGLFDHALTLVGAGRTTLDEALRLKPQEPS